MGQTHWLVDEVKENFRSPYNLGKFLTINELMIGYKEKYCLARQYMLKNLIPKVGYKGMVSCR